NWLTYDDGIAFSPDRKLLAMASGDGTVGLWETDTGRKLRALTGHKRMLTAAAFSPDGRTLASASIDKTIRIWDVAEGKELKRWPVKAEEVRPLVFSPDGKLLAWATGEDSVIHLWSAESGKEVRRLEGHAGGALDNGFFERPTLIVFAPDGRTVLTSRQNDPALRLWEVASGKERRQLQQPELVTGSNGALIAAAFSPTGRVLACSRLDGTVELWETITGKRIAQFRGHRDSVRSLVFSADGRRLASGSSDSTVLLWDVTGGPARERP
ncbi:MAG TPA: WD40 repeat domain-containing protein, partial [Gemmataceae bacterium]|nr:WD40 repeat domain-containing protein [Gemmataceae bacterium]